LENPKFSRQPNDLLDEVDGDSISFIEIFNQIKIHKYLIAGVTTLFLILSIIYALAAKDIYSALTVLKIEPPKGSILGGGIFDEINNNQNDRYISNEIELLQSFTIRDGVASAMIDSFNITKDTNNFYLILNRDYFDSEKPVIHKHEALASSFSASAKSIAISQKRGLDYIEILVKSPSPFEAALLANTYANVYLDYNLQDSRREVANVTRFLEKQMGEKFNLLTIAEDTLKYFRLIAGVVELNIQAENLISTISDFETKKNTAEIELIIAQNTLNEYKGEMLKIDPTVSKFLDSKTDEPYLLLLQEQIAKLRIQRDMAASTSKNSTTNLKALEQYNFELAEMNNKLNTHIAEYQKKLQASSPDEVKELTKLIFEQEVNIQALTASVKHLNKILKDYDAKFSNLPQATLELARLERNKLALEKLYLVLEEKYQEALINEQSIPGNVVVIDKARKPNSPSGPNRKLIILIGLFLGLGVSVAIIYAKDLFSNKINTPEDIQKKNIRLLGWIPQFNGSRVDSDFVVKENPTSVASESYRAVRTKIQFSKEMGEKVQTILITSALPDEGKTTTSINIAGSFALADKKVILMGCDFRKPRLHTFFSLKKSPGITEYLKGQAKWEEIIYKTDMNNLFFVPSGAIPKNPSELLGSTQMEQLLEIVKQKADIVVIDSAPLLPVTDTELISKLVDASILVVSSARTEYDTMKKSIELLNNIKQNFIGTVLNNFGDKYANNSYYKYYYYYSHDNTKKGEKKR
jgi:polysaccharide biosynthesis transport protein